MTVNEHRPDLLTRTPEGSIRVVGTRITIESIILGFQDGATPEEICQDFPALALAQVYDVLAFYRRIKQRSRPISESRHTSRQRQDRRSRPDTPHF